MSVIGPYYSVPKINRYISIGLTTNDPVPCVCTACVENWPTIELLPSFLVFVYFNKLVIFKSIYSYFLLC